MPTATSATDDATTPAWHAPRRDPTIVIANATSTQPIASTGACA